MPKEQEWAQNRPLQDAYDQLELEYTDDWWWIPDDYINLYLIYLMNISFIYMVNAGINNSNE